MINLDPGTKVEVPIVILLRKKWADFNIWRISRTCKLLGHKPGPWMNVVHLKWQKEMMEKDKSIKIANRHALCVRCGKGIEQFDN